MLKWIYIYGPPRTGSTYLLRQIRKKSIHSVSDWGLGVILKPFVAMPGGIDKDRFLCDLAKNLLDRSRKNEQGELDLVLKAANGNFEEFEGYKKMFGFPLRIIFSVREPSGYMSSAIKKFPEEPVEFLQDSYLKMLQLYPSIGGDIIDYNQNLGSQCYQKFLLPLEFPDNEIETFEYKGTPADHLMTDEMKNSYQEFLRENQDKVFKP